MRFLILILTIIPILAQGAEDELIKPMDKSRVVKRAPVEKNNQLYLVYGKGYSPIESKSSTDTILGFTQFKESYFYGGELQQIVVSGNKTGIQNLIAGYTFQNMFGVLEFGLAGTDNTDGIVYGVGLGSTAKFEKFSTRIEIRDKSLLYSGRSPERHTSVLLGGSFNF